MLKLITSTAVLLASCSCLFADVLLTNFGSPSFTVDGSTDFPSSPQTASSITITGVDTNQLVGTFLSVNISGMSDFLRIDGSVTQNPGSQFRVDLFDGEFDTATYISGSWTDLAGGQTTLSLSTPMLPANFDPTNVIGLALVGGGGGDPVTATLTGATAIPEPTSALILVLGGSVLAITRRRR